MPLCLVCGSEIQALAGAGRPRKTCGALCAETRNKDRYVLRTTERECEICRKNFNQEGAGRPRKTCSILCATTLDRARYVPVVKQSKPVPEKLTRECVICGEIFPAKFSWKTCGPNCHEIRTAKRLEAILIRRKVSVREGKTCGTCSGPIPLNRKCHDFCSAECSGRHKRARRSNDRSLRRARIRETVYQRVSGKFWAEAIILWDSRCAYCLRLIDALEMDHFVPLFRGGAHTKYNIVPACKSCNSSKGAQDPFAFLHDIGRRRLEENAFTLPERLAMLAA